MHLAIGHDKINAIEDLLILDAGMEIANF